MNQYLNEPLTFLIDVLFGIYILVVMLRFLFQLMRVDYNNPVSQAIVMVTNPPLRVLRRLIPSIGKIDTSSIILMLLLQFISITLIFMLKGIPFLPLTYLMLSIIELVNLTFNVFIFSIIILAVLSWVSTPYHHNPLAMVLEQLTRPLIKPARRLIPPTGGIDLSPMLVLVGLFFLKLLLIPPLQDLAKLISI